MCFPSIKADKMLLDAEAFEMCIRKQMFKSVKEIIAHLKILPETLNSDKFIVVKQRTGKKQR